jgi:putative heme-binding domain-containing protein
MGIRAHLALALVLAGVAAGWGLIPATTLVAQQHTYTPGDIEEGGRLFRLNCIGCHGPEGNLVTGIDLGRNRFRRVSTDEEIVNVIQNGVPDTGMPPNPMLTLRAYNVVAYLRNMNASSRVTSIAAASGDAVRGKALFAGKGACNTCHRVRGEGSRNGPDLSETGLMLRAIEIEGSILDPDADVSTSNRSFRAVRKDGTSITGLLLNQDTFTVQLLDANGSLASIQKSDLQESGFVNRSSMPSYRDTFNPQELADLIAYLSSLKGT